MGSGPGSPLQRWSDDEAPCPFCGRNVVWWSGGDEPCEHLLVGWAIDPNDNGGGVLGEDLSHNDGIAGADRVARLAGHLCGWVWSAGQEVVEDRLKLAEDALEGEKPEWWPALHKAIVEYDDPDVVLEYYGPGADIDDVDPEFLAEDFANPLAEAVVQDLPGTTVTYATIGGMTSGDDIFVWSEDPIAGRTALDAAFESAIRSLETVIATLDCRP
jgi:hypothetical protein